MKSHTTRRLAGFLLLASSLAGEAASDWFEVQVLDRDTKRGVPLVELETVDRVGFVTDNAGRVAFGEPGWMGREVYLGVKSHGYEHVKDGFGFAGVRVRPVAGGKAVVELRRLNVAERLYRVTGAGLYRDSVLLGHEVPLAAPTNNGDVVGQDSAQVVVYGGRARWFWGDTSRAGYPLGNFRTTGATSELPGRGGLDPDVGINLRYELGGDGFTRQMCAFEPSEGVVWIDGLAVVRGADGRERMVARFTRLKSLGAPLEQGVAEFDDEKGEFVRGRSIPLEEGWRCPRGQALTGGTGVTGQVYYCTPFPTVRVKAEVESVSRPEAYEAWTCLEKGSVPGNPETMRVRRLASGRAEWRWTGDAPPLTPKDEQALVESGRLGEEDVYGVPRDVETGKRVILHGGSVRWNAVRQRWVLVAVQEGGSSYLGEVWYGEARELTGPWRKVRKIVTHDRYTFYNPVQHAFLDKEGGRSIYFEGTYSREFSGNPVATPRYDYNQVMYRLDVEDPRLAPVREGD